MPPRGKQAAGKERAQAADARQEPEPLPVSVCMLVLNEADRLPRTLPPLRAFAEVIVYDSGSTDLSLRLCEEFGARIERGPWLGFSETRRRLFSLARQPWILWLDADEVVTDKLLAAMRRELTGNEPACAAYAINRIVCFQRQWIRHGDWFPDWNVRLFRQDAWSIPGRAVHEAVRIEGKVCRLTGLIEHFTYRDWADQRRRSERYANLWAEQALAEGRRGGRVRGLARAGWRLFRGIVFKTGFLDGVLGLQVAWANACEVYGKYRQLGELWRARQGEQAGR